MNFEDVFMGKILTRFNNYIELELKKPLPEIVHPLIIKNKNRLVNKVEKSKKKFSCHLCGKTFGKKFNLNKHLRTIEKQKI